MIEYIFQISVCWVVFYVLYFCFLSRETYFHLNRLYLLATLALGLMLPIMPVSPGMITGTDLTIQLEEITIGISKAIDGTKEHNSISILIWGYFVGMGFMLIRFIYGLGIILRLAKEGKWIEKRGFYIVETTKDHTPFSFFNIYFKNINLNASVEEDYNIELHEKIHIREGHSFDILFIEILTILFWFNPIIYLYKKSLRNIHEYLADAGVLKNTSASAYGRLLIGFQSSGASLGLANHFTKSQLKKRIEMMTKETSGLTSLTRYILLLPAIFALVIVIPMQTNGRNFHSKTFLQPALKHAEEMPRFPGCEDLSGKEREDCALKNMLSFIYTNISYPKEAREQGIQGTTIVQFVVENDGSISELDVARPIGGGCEEETIRVLRLFPKMIPGKHKGKPVRIKYTLPVKFRLDK